MRRLSHATWEHKLVRRYPRTPVPADRHTPRVPGGSRPRTVLYRTHARGFSRAVAPLAPAYRPRCPAGTVLYSVVSAHLESFLAYAAHNRRYVASTHSRPLACPTCFDGLLAELSDGKSVADVTIRQFGDRVHWPEGRRSSFVPLASGLRRRRVSPPGRGNRFRRSARPLLARAAHLSARAVRPIGSFRDLTRVGGVGARVGRGKRRAIRVPAGNEVVQQRPDGDKIRVHTSGPSGSHAPSRAGPATVSVGITSPCAIQYGKVAFAVRRARVGRPKAVRTQAIPIPRRRASICGWQDRRKILRRWGARSWPRSAFYAVVRILWRVFAMCAVRAARGGFARVATCTGGRRSGVSATDESSERGPGDDGSQPPRPHDTKFAPPAFTVPIADARQRGCDRNVARRCAPWGSSDARLAEPR